MKFVSNLGNKYELIGLPISSDVELLSYDVVEDRMLIANIYRVNIPIKEKEEKLIAMTDIPIHGKYTEQFSWPTELLYKNDEFKGFITKKMNTSMNLNRIYIGGPGSSQKDLSWAKRVIIAKNLCTLVDKIQGMDQVCGNLSSNIISVDYNGSVFFTDADSFHIFDAQKNVYRCNKGSSGYLPKEIQIKLKNEDLMTASLPTFTKESDHFALAVNIFQLLMNGIHPFEGNVQLQDNLKTDPTPNEKIIRGEVPFFKRGLGTDIPLFAPPIDMLPKYIRDLFKKSLTENKRHSQNRPTSLEWKSALEELSMKIVKCDDDPKHEYHESYGRCPWCEIDGRYGGKEAKKKSNPAGNDTGKKKEVLSERVKGFFNKPSSTQKPVRSPVQTVPNKDYSTLMTAWSTVKDAYNVLHKGYKIGVNYSSDGSYVISLRSGKIRIYQDRVETGTIFRTVASNVYTTVGTFQEESKKKTNAEQVSARWLHERVDGGPDRRYKDNYLTYKYRYGWFSMYIDGVEYRFTTNNQDFSNKFRYV